MKKIAIIATLSLFPLISFGQQEPHTPELDLDHSDVSNIDRYHLDYELINYTFVNGDSSILESLNILGMLEARHYTDDIIITDISQNVQILVYSETRALEEREISLVFDKQKRKNQ